MIDSLFRNEAIWVFTDNWSEAVFGDLVAGYSVLIVYDGARLPWRDTKYGQRAWNIYAQFKFDDGKVHQQLLQGPIMIEGSAPPPPPLVILSRVFKVSLT